MNAGNDTGIFFFYSWHIFLVMKKWNFTTQIRQNTRLMNKFICA